MQGGVVWGEIGECEMVGRMLVDISHVFFRERVDTWDAVIGARLCYLACLSE